MSPTRVFCHASGFVLAVVFCLVRWASIPAAAQNWDQVQWVRHSTYQAVNPDGTSAYTGGFPVRLRGVVINNNEDWLDPTANYTPTYVPFAMGGQAEFYIQAVDLPEVAWDDGDFGGTAVWIGQNYGNLPWKGDPVYSYTNQQWYAELDRLRLYRPGTTVSPLVRAGDLVEVRARGGLNYRGKRNINEEHNNDPSMDYEIVILQKNYGLPAPSPINLADIKTAANADIFDPTRLTGGERYQGTLVELRHVRFQSTAGWASNTALVVEDGTGRTLPVRLGNNPALGSMTPPSGFFDLVGVFDQSSASGRDGYQVLALSPSGFLLSGDLNRDGLVGGADLDAVLANWGSTVPKGNMLLGDASADGAVTGTDLDIVLSNWGRTAPAGAGALAGVPAEASAAPVPEPATLASVICVAATGAIVLLRRNRRRLVQQIRAMAAALPTARQTIGSAAIAAAIVLASTTAALCGPTLLFQETPNTASLAPQYLTNDMIFITSSDWLSAQLLITLSSGSIYQHSFGGNTPPNPALVAAFPDLAFDTFVAGGSLDITPMIVGGAVDLGGGAAAVCNESVVNLTWATTNTNDIGNLLLGRITLSRDAQGTWAARVSNVGDGAGFYSGPIVGGAMVPEPATASMLLCAAMLALGWQMRRRIANR